MPLSPLNAMLILEQEAFLWQTRLDQYRLPEH